MLLMTGGGLLLLGLLCGVAMLGAPLGLLPGPTDITVWVLFPAFTLGGLVMAALGAAGPALSALCRLTGALLVLLGLAAAATLVAGATGLSPVSGSGGLWYVLALGLLMGPVSLSIAQKARA